MEHTNDVALARREPDAPLDRLQALLGSVALTREVDVGSNGPPLRPDRRVALLDGLYRAAIGPDRGAHRAIGRSVVHVNPDPRLAGALLAEIGRMREQFAYGRKQPWSEFSNDHERACEAEGAPAARASAGDSAGEPFCRGPAWGRSGGAVGGLAQALDGFLAM